MGSEFPNNVFHAEFSPPPSVAHKFVEEDLQKDISQDPNVEYDEHGEEVSK